jgi:hypothetical protein
VKGDAVFQTAGDPTDVTVWHDFETLAKAKKFAGSQHLKDVMKGNYILDSITFSG